MGDLEKQDKELNIDIENLVSHIDLIEYVSQYIELQEKNSEFWTSCCFHSGDETASLAFNPEKQVWFCLGCKRSGNVYSFAKEYHKLSPSETVMELCSYAKLDVGEVQAPTDIIKQFRFMKRNFNKKHIDINHKVLNKDCMLVYDKEPIKEWLEEGISQEVLEKYDVRYDRLNNAIAFPIFDDDGNIINIKKRTLQKNFKDLKRPKYINLYKIGKLDYLWGFAQNKHKYNDYKSLILFEGEKSVMKLETAGYFNSVALSTSSITKEQANTLIKTNKDIVIAMDKGIDMEHIRRNFSYLSRFTNTFVIFDRNGLLEDKMAPIDNGIEVFKKLYEQRIKI